MTETVWMREMIESEWMTKKETASYLRRSTRTLDRWIGLKYFPAGTYKLGRPYWRVKDIEKWMTTRPDLKC